MQEPSGSAAALSMPLGSSTPAGSAAGGTAQIYEAGASKGAAGSAQDAGSLRGRLRQVLASATVQLPSQGPKRRRKAGSAAPGGGAGARVLEGRARLLVLAPRPDRPFSAGGPCGGLGDGDSTGSDVPPTAEEAAESRARKDASLGVGAPVSEAARRLGLELGGVLPMLAPANGGAPPIIPDTIGLLGCGGPPAEAPPRPAASAASAETDTERSRGAGGGQGGGEGEGEEEEPLLGHAWETGRCFTIPMTVMYRISTDLGQVGPAAVSLCIFSQVCPRHCRWAAATCAAIWVWVAPSHACAMQELQLSMHVARSTKEPHA